MSGSVVIFNARRFFFLAILFLNIQLCGQMRLARIEVDSESVNLCSVAKVSFKQGVPWRFNTLHKMSKKKRGWVKEFVPVKSLVISSSNDKFVLFALNSKRTKVSYFFMLYRSLSNRQNIVLLPIGMPLEVKSFYYIDLNDIDFNQKKIVYKSDTVQVNDRDDYLSLHLSFDSSDDVQCDFQQYDYGEIGQVYDTGVISDVE